MPSKLTDQPINFSTDNTVCYALHLADNALLLGQRNAEWTGHGPVLEQDIAISNISLDLIGQARHFYQYAALRLNETGNLQEVTEDTLAYLRDTPYFKNCLMVELPRGDWAFTVLRQFLFSTYQFYLFQPLQQSSNAPLAAIAEKSLKETTYHLRWSAEWVIRLGDGTAESKSRMQTALQALWPYTEELLTPASYETELLQDHIAVNPQLLSAAWHSKVKEVFQEATLDLPAAVWMQSGGKEGRHTEQHGYLLAEMQFLQRAYPGATW